MREKFGLTLGLITALGLATGCATSSKSPLQAYNERVDAEIAKHQTRTPAASAVSASSLGARFDDLRKAGTFEVYVFPKSSNITSRVKGKVEVDLMKPQKFEVSPFAISPCKAFKDGFQKQIGANLIFKDASAPNCAAIRVTSVAMKTVNKALIRNGDRLSETIFLDDTYANYGIQHEIYRNGQTKEMIAQDWEASEPSSSGLTNFPIDLPNFQRLETSMTARVNEDFSEDLDGLALLQAKKLKKGFQWPSCGQGSLITYKDNLGSTVRVGWCNNQPWPQYVETNRYIAVTQELGGAK